MRTISSVVGVDPGTEQSAWVHYDGSKVLHHGIEPNAEMLRRCQHNDWVWLQVDANPHHHNINSEIVPVVFERVEAMGMAVGRQVFETVFVTGRMYEAVAHGAPLGSDDGGRRDRLYRTDVKLHLCGQRRANDANIRQALVDMFTRNGQDAIGNRKQPGPLFGIKSHEWAALAVAVTWWETKTTKPGVGQETRQ